MGPECAYWFLVIVIPGNCQLPVIAGNSSVPSGQGREGKVFNYSSFLLLSSEEMEAADNSVCTKYSLRRETIFKSRHKCACHPFGERGEIETNHGGARENIL